MKIGLTKSDVKFLFENIDYFEQFIRLLQQVRCVIADDLKIVLEDGDVSV